MTKITINYNDEAGYMCIKVNGHANYAPKGKDIVCAGVSVIMQTAMLGLREIFKQFPGYITYKEEYVDVQEID